MKISYSEISPTGGTAPVREKAVAYGGWQWTTARARGLALYISRCRRISLVRGRLPATMLPSKSERQISEGSMSHLLIIVCVHTTYFVQIRELMLPQYPSTHCRSHSFRPTQM